MLADMPLSSLRDRVLALRSLETFAGLGDDTLGFLAENSRYRQVRRGEVLLHEGGPVNTVHMVVEGRVQVSRHGAVLTDVERGSGVGLLSLFAHDPQGVHAVAMVDTITLDLPGQLVLELLEEDFALLRTTMSLAAQAILRSRSGLPVAPGSAPPELTTPYPESSLTLVQQILRIQQNPLFASANLDALVTIARNLTEVRMPPGTLLWRAGEPSEYQLRLDHGIVECSNPAGQSVRVTAPFNLGGLDALAGQPRSYTAVSHTALVGYRNDREGMWSVFETHPELPLGLQTLLARTLLDRQ
jgi:CRP-like cAMP-binding protein